MRVKVCSKCQTLKPVPFPRRLCGECRVPNWQYKPSTVVEPKPDVHGWIYAIKEDHAKGFTKIGFSVSPDTRVDELQVGNPRKLYIVGMWKGTMRDEQDLQRQFEHLWVRGEWFRHSKEIDQYIKANTHPAFSNRSVAARFGSELT